jgi:hypothetical protein
VGLATTTFRLRFSSCRNSTTPWDGSSDANLSAMSAWHHGLNRNWLNFIKSFPAQPSPARPRGCPTRWWGRPPRPALPTPPLRLSDGRGRAAGLAMSTSPSSRCRSVRHTPQACTRSSSSPGPARGIGRSRARSGRPTSSKTIVRIEPVPSACAIVRPVKQGRGEAR